jgi:dTDP-4-dehydrorhamnose reductase
VIRQHQPDVVINAAAQTAVDEAQQQPERAFAINATAVGVLGEEAARCGAWVVHYSTDYVFDGHQNRPYRETDTPHPLNVYGASKWAGERALQASGARHLIFRSSWVLGIQGRNFPKTMLQQAMTKDHVPVVCDQWGCPTTATLIADVTAQAIPAAMTQSARLPEGLYHVAADGLTNWHAYAVYVIEAARQAGWPIRVQAQAVEAVSSAQYIRQTQAQTPGLAKRPTYSALDTSRLRQALGLSLSPWQEGVDQVLQHWFSMGVERAMQEGKTT